MAPYVRRILLRVHAPGSAGGCEEQQERRCAPRYGSVHFSGTTGHLTLKWHSQSYVLCVPSLQQEFRPVW